MLVAFGSVVAMGLPILTALAGVGAGYAVVALISHLLIDPSYSPELMAMIGLGVGIDYAVFIVTRYRHGLGEGLQPRDAVARAMPTAGRAALFAGTTVLISLLGLFLIGQQYLDGLAARTILAVMGRDGRLPEPAAGHARLLRPRHRPPAPARRGPRATACSPAPGWADHRGDAADGRGGRCQPTAAPLGAADPGPAPRTAGTG
jgi:MMPL family